MVARALRLRNLVGLVIAAPFVAAGAAGARYTAWAAAARRRGASVEPGVPTPGPSLGLAGAVALDTLVTMPMGLLASGGSAEHYARSSAEVDDAVDFYDRAGWLHEPAGRHPAPTDVPDGQIEPARRDGLETLRFESRWEPVEGEPGGERWRSFTANRVVPVRLMRHPGDPRPWLVMLHGQGMGRSSDHRMLGVRRLHEQLGLNVALPVLPLHGSRGAGYAPDRLFVSNVYPLNNVLGVSQAVWDVRRLLLWLGSEQGATAIGVAGLSLGSYVSSVLATLETDLACVVALVPEPDLAGSLRAAEPTLPSKRRLHRALYDERVTTIYQSISPLARPCLLPQERRFIVAGQADRIARPAGAAQLWRHWEEPSILWQPRGHVTAARGRVYDDHLSSALAASGLVTAPSAGT